MITKRKQLLEYVLSYIGKKHIKEVTLASNYVVSFYLLDIIKVDEFLLNSLSIIYNPFEENFIVYLARDDKSYYFSNQKRICNRECLEFILANINNKMNIRFTE